MVRDAEGKIVVARSILLQGGGDSFLAEALSCKEALSWLKEIQIDNRCFKCG